MGFGFDIGGVDFGLGFKVGEIGLSVWSECYVGFGVRLWFEYRGVGVEVVGNINYCESLLIGLQFPDISLIFKFKISSVIFVDGDIKLWSEIQSIKILKSEILVQ